MPPDPHFVQKLLGGKKTADKLRRHYEDIEHQLNEFGWKTVAE